MSMRWTLNQEELTEAVKLLAVERGVAIDGELSFSREPGGINEPARFQAHVDIKGLAKLVGVYP